jgi:Fe-S oxidoreductase
MPRTRENAFCCGAGRGTQAAFPELASFSAKHRLKEVNEVSAEALVSACPWCKSNFAKAVKENGDKVTVMDIAEIILAAVER